MDILSYLLELLQQRKEVGITDLGTFYKKKFPGRYDKEKQSFLPPSYALQFSADVKEDESLTEFISTKRNISAESATYYISQFVDEVKQKLELENESELENLGRLFFTEHEGLSFEPGKNINYGSEFYGLPSLPETIVKDSNIDVVKTDDEDIFDEIAEAPAAPVQAEEVKEIEYKHPIIENIELDEVKDDFKNTLKHTEKPNDEVVEAPKFIKEQHEEHPNRFGHTPESEVLSNSINHEIEVPESVKEQHEENPNRFDHTPGSEDPKTYIKLEDDAKKEEDVIEAPEFIKEQHAEHPNRFGHDPLIDEPAEEESKWIWPKIMIAIFILLVLGAILYFVKPELFNRQAKVETLPPPAIVDSPKVNLDTTKAKQDSTAKTDSILKANQVQQKPIDSAKKSIPVTAAIKPKNTGPASFDIIGASYKTVKGAEKYIKDVKRVGIDAKIVKIHGPRQHISIGSYKTQKEAEDNLIILQKKLKGKGFYVQQIVNNTQP